MEWLKFDIYIYIHCNYIGIHDILLSCICFPQQAGELTASLNNCIVWVKETSHETVTVHQETIIRCKCEVENLFQTEQFQSGLGEKADFQHRN